VAEDCAAAILGSETKTEGGLMYRVGFGELAPVAAVTAVYIDPNAKPVTCFKLFGNSESCIGPVGSMTLFLGLGGAVVLFMMGKGGRR
jgi:hypothetical protein